MYMLSSKQSRRTSLCQEISSKSPEPYMMASIKISSPMPASSGGQLRQGLKTSNKSLSYQKLDAKFVCSPASNEKQSSNHTFNKNDKSLLTSIQKIGNLNLKNALFVLRKLIEQCALFHSRFGYSGFEIQNCFICSSGDLMLSQSSPTSSINKQSNETVVVSKIVSEIHKLCQPKVFQDFVSYFKRSQSKHRADFKFTQSLIKSYCMCSKIQLKQKFQFEQISSNQLLKPQLNKTLNRAISSVGQKSNQDSERRGTFGDSNDGDVKNIFGSKSQKTLITERFRNKDTKKSADCTNSSKTIKQKMSRSNQIALQFNLKIGNPERQKIKQSLTSTNNKTSGNLSSQKGQTFDQSLPRLETFGSPAVSLPVICQPFVFSNIQQIQSQCESSYDYEPPSPPSFKDKNQSKTQQKQANSIFQNNQWVKRVDNLFSNRDEIKQSFIQGKDQQAIVDYGFHPEELGKMARVLTQSFLAKDHNSSSKN